MKMATPGASNAEALKTQMAAAVELAGTNPAEAVKAYRAVVFSPNGADTESAKVKEQGIDALSKLLAKLQDAPALKLLLTELRPLFAVVPKAKTAKIVRNVIDVFATVPGSDDLQVELCKEQVAWAKEEKRTFLRHRVELRLSTLYLEKKAFQDALKLIGALAFEVKKLDDKLLLVDIHLLESRIHYALRNMPKVRESADGSFVRSNEPREEPKPARLLVPLNRTVAPLLTLSFS